VAVGLVGAAAAWSTLHWRVQRPPSPSAARLPSSARILLAPFHKDTLDLTVAAQGELNYRVGMQAGATLVYAWSTARPSHKLLCEFAGRPASGDASEGHSAFVAQSSGWYRWRWKNQNSHPVTIHLKLNGYYEEVTIPSASMPYHR
jgi:hypothetical protein